MERAGKDDAEEEWEGEGGPVSAALLARTLLDMSRRSAERETAGGAGASAWRSSPKGGPHPSQPCSRWGASSTTRVAAKESCAATAS